MKTGPTGFVLFDTPTPCLLLCGLLLVPLPARADDPMAGLPDPTRPENLVQARQAARSVDITRLVLESTLVSPERRLAVVNGKTLAVGDNIDDVKITAITPFEVTAYRNGQQLRMRLLPRNAVSEKRQGQVKDD